MIINEKLSNKKLTKNERLEIQSQKVQYAYEGKIKLEGIDKETFIRNEMQPFINKLIKEKWRGKEYDKQEQAYTKVDFKADLNEWVIKHIRSYDVTKEKRLTQYIQFNTAHKVPGLL